MDFYYNQNTSYALIINCRTFLEIILVYIFQLISFSQCTYYIEQYSNVNFKRQLCITDDESYRLQSRLKYKKAEMLPANHGGMGGLYSISVKER